MRAITLSRGTRDQCGAALVIGLLILTLSTILGLSAMQTHVLDERMAGHFKEINLAFQAAEAALRDAESDITASPARISGLTGFNATCSNGLCDATSGLMDVWLQATTEPNGVALGSFTGGAALAGLSCQPRYWIEGFKVRPAGSPSWKVRYRITATACGSDDNTSIRLQTVFAPR
jgi:type IV pilus assembly protein PilX